MSASPFFDAAFKIVIGEEGGYTSNPMDPGGETKYGISKAAYPTLDIKDLTLDQAKDIYLNDYWYAVVHDTDTWEEALCKFDCGVNQGVGAAKSMWLLSRDVPDFMAHRAVRYAELSDFSTFGHGWMRRLFTIFKAAQVTPT